MEMLQYEEVPRIYSLRWCSEEKAILVQVHKDCIGSSESIAKKAPWVQAMAEMHELDGLFDSFSGDLKNGSFGFNGLIERQQSSGDYVDYFVRLPRIKQETRFVCEECDGTGKRLTPCSFPEDKCMYCWGSGCKHFNDWRSAYATTASLGLLLDLLSQHGKTSARERQHVTVSMLANPGQHGSSLGGCFGIDFSEYLSHGSECLIERILPKAVEAMKAAHSFMFSFKDYGLSGFRGDARNGFLSLGCPGDACGIHLSDHENNHRGREFSCHNVDSPLQSMTLFAGISSIVGAIDDALSKRL